MAEYKAIAPSAAGFTDYIPQYGASLAGKTGNLAWDLGNQAALMRRADGAGGGYLQALKEAQDAQLRGQQIVTQGELQTHALDQAAPMSQAGIAGAILPQYLPGVGSGQIDAADTVHLNKDAADAYGKKAAGVGALAQAGYGMKPGGVGQVMMGPLDTMPQNFLNYVDPGDVAAQSQAAAAHESAAASMVRANREPTAKELKEVYSPGMYGMPPVIQYRGSPAQIAAQLAAEGGVTQQPAPAGGKQRPRTLAEIRASNERRKQGAK